ncbi:AEC family transporter [Dongshaea marina]|uniref:AEC family transporter n=1 Tax=Dongshaea marina TaxID=2047966 RepID=UPI000D3EAABF|nr:AEC family transporter [Dongshaea marina]
MEKVFATTSVLFLAIFLGFIMGHSKIFKKGSDLTLIHFVFYIALPIALFLSCYHSHFSVQEFQYSLAYIISMLIIIGLLLLISFKVMKKSLAESIMSSIAVSQVDGAYFTIPLFMLVFVSPVLAIPLMAIQNIIFFTLTILVIEIVITTSHKVPQGSSLLFIIKRTAKVLCTNPIIASSLLGFIAGSLAIPLNAQLTKFMHFMGATSAPVALFALGISCAHHLKHWKSSEDIASISLITLFKLLLFPAIALGVGSAMQLPHHYLVALVLLCASPTATHNYIIANKYQLGAQTQTFVVVATTLLSFISINLWLMAL